jgi:hypothetical protein
MTKYAGRTITYARNTTGSTYVNIGQILELSKLGSSRDTIDASAYGDTWKDFLVGLQEGDEVTLRIAIDPADTQHVALKGDYDAGLSKKFHLINTAISPTRTLEVTAIPTEYHEGGDLDGVYEVEMIWKIVSPGVVLV